MQYMKLDATQREELLNRLAHMPAFLTTALSGLTPEQIRLPGPDGAFSPVEQVWHLADLEREGFGERIRRLLSEPQPYLPDFDGAGIAVLRNYRTLSFEQGLAAFTTARERNIEVFRSLDAPAWRLSGTQEGV